MSALILAIDAGTTVVTVQLVDGHRRVVGRGYSEFEQHFPQPGWVEHDPEQIWQAVQASGQLALKTAGVEAGAVTAIGITNQRETVVFWDRKTLQAPRRAIVWQDRRTADVLSEPKFAACAEQVRQLSGLPLDPYFSSSKLLWVKRNQPEVWAAIEAGQTAVGTVDSYLVARLTGGKTHITDASNASRTQLYNLRTGGWDSWLLDLFEVPETALPKIVPSWGQLAVCEPESFLGVMAPITGIAGDQQAALFGQLAFADGGTKCTYGTGAFLLQNTGDRIVLGNARLLATVAWQGPDGQLTYALEGSVFIAGAAIQWLRDGLKLITTAPEVNELAARVPDSGGVFFVPALSGLGVPFWDPNARGAFFGITRGTTNAHFARAAIDALAFQVRALVDAMAGVSHGDLQVLRVDGGAAASDLLLQAQADVLGIPVERPSNLNTTGMGAAYLAGLGAGIWRDGDDLEMFIGSAQEFTPVKNRAEDYQKWLRAVAAAQSWR